MTPVERKLRAEIAAHASWKNTTDRAARTAPARRAAARRFEREVDPEGVLDPAERAKRSDHARREHMARMTLTSARVRRQRSKGNR